MSNKDNITIGLAHNGHKSAIYLFYSLPISEK